MLAKLTLICALIIAPSLAFSKDTGEYKATKEEIENALYYKKHTKDSTYESPYGHCIGYHNRYRWDDVCKRLSLHKKMSVDVADIYEQKFYEFKTALHNRDVEAVSELIAYPLKLYYVKPGTKLEDWPRDLETKYINTPEEFAENFDFIFNDLFSKSIEKAKFTELADHKLSFSIISAFSDINFHLYCSGKSADWKIDPKKDCKNPDAKISLINNDETVDSDD